MAQQEYDAFKQRLKDWMDSHPEEYAAFETEMNRMDGTGYRKIMALASSLAPGYDDAIDKKIGEGSFSNITDLAGLLSGNNIGDKLLEGLDAPDTNPMLPAMLCWLYFGRSFENMVELGEELMAGAGISRHQQFNIAHTSKNIIEGSVNLDLRTKEDWTDYSKIKHAIDNNRIVDWALEYEQETPEVKQPGRKKTEMPLHEMLSTKVRGKEKLLKRIGEYLISRHSELDLARLKIALDELGYLRPSIEIRPFRNAIAAQYGESVKIVGERGIQRAYSRLTSTLSINNQKLMNIGDDLIAIKQLRDFLAG